MRNHQNRFADVPALLGKPRCTAGVTTAQWNNTMMLTNLKILWNRLGNPEYLHLLLEPIPLAGLFFGLLFFSVGLFLKQDKTRLIALIVLAAASLSVIPYTQARDRAMDRILKLRDASYTRLINQQTKLRKETRWVYYTIAGLALITLLGGGKIAALGNYLLLIAGLAALIFTLWLHLKEAEVYHPNLRKATVGMARHPSIVPPVTTPSCDIAFKSRHSVVPFRVPCSRA